MIRPVIVYLEGDLGTGVRENFFRDALAYCLRTELDCEVLVYSDGYYLKDDWLRIRKLAGQGMLLGALIAQDRYGEGYIDAVTQLISDGFTGKIVVLKNSLAESPAVLTVQGLQLPAIADHSEALGVFTESRRTWHHDGTQHDYFDVRTEEELAALSSRLVAVHRARSDGDEQGVLGPLSNDHRLVAEALRIRLLTPNIHEEFDQTVRRLEKPARSSVSPVDRNTYDKEVDLIRAYSPVEREDFCDKMLHATGYVRADHGVIKTEVGCGHENMGFAIDVHTLESAISHGFGLHEYAVQMLRNRLEYVDEIKTRRGDRVSGEQERTLMDIMSGIIIKKLPGFKTSVLILSDGGFSAEEIRSIGLHIRAQGEVIPVSSYGVLLGE